MTARLLSLAGRVWRRVWPHEVVDARRAWGRDMPVPGAGAADARERRRDAIRHLDDPADIRRAFAPIVADCYRDLPRPRGGDQ